MDYGGLRDAAGASLPLKKTVRMLRRTRRRLRRIGKYANWRMDNPFSSHLQPGRLVNWFHVGTPVAGGEERTHRDSLIHVLHSPSVPLVKGTSKIVAACEACRQTVPELTLTLITGRPNREVLEALKSCDFVVDQLYADVPCAGFVLEAAGFGKPAVVGGLGWSDEWLQFSGLAEYPAHVVDPDGIEEGIRRMAVDADFRECVAAAARRLARQWDVAAVAERLETVLRGAAPPEWTFDPAELPVFCSGCGIPRETIADAIRRIARVYGWSELGLDDKPRLLAMAKEFAAKW
jgi:glycosyltransferase involved in cell wall biosynthesis